jgi:hypothetical protein
MPLDNEKPTQIDAELQEVAKAANHVPRRNPKSIRLQNRLRLNGRVEVLVRRQLPLHEADNDGRQSETDGATEEGARDREPFGAHVFGSDGSRDGIAVRVLGYLGPLVG